MPKLSDHALDPKLLDTGVWWDFARRLTCPGNKPTEGAGCFLVRPLVGNDAYHVALDEKLSRHAGTLRDKDTAEDIKKAIRAQAHAEATAAHVLRGWSGWDDLPPFDEQKAVEILLQRRWKGVAEFIVNASLTADAALQREEEQAKGN